MPQKEKRTARLGVAKTVLIALLVVGLLRSCFFELYRVPSSQMEASIEVGDRLFVNKWSYGLRLPMAWLGVPFTHDSIGSVRTYSTLLQLPYTRLFAKPVGRNDVVVFNHPIPPYQHVPVDRRKVYLSRCVALPGDTVRYHNGNLYINEQLQQQSPQLLTAHYYAEADREVVELALQMCRITERAADVVEQHRVALFTLHEYQQILSFFDNDSSLVKPIYNPDEDFHLVLPQRDRATPITPHNIGMLHPLIVLHEGEKVERVGNQIRKNGKVLTHYVFHQDYYWMMSDNRVASLDSRHFGAVPHSHVMGKATHVAYSISQYNKVLQPIH